MKMRLLNYRKALQKDPAFVEAIYGLALADIKIGRLPQAYAGLKRARELRPAQEDMAAALADVCLFSYAYDPSHPRKLYEEALKITADLERKNPNSFQTVRLHGYLASVDGNNPEAIRLFRQANRIKPLQPDVVVPLMKLLIEAKLGAEAEELGSAMLARDKTLSGIYDVLYGQRISAGDIAAAEKVLQQHVQNNPRDAGAVLKLCRHHAAANKADSLVQSCASDLLRRSGEFPRIHIRVADFWMELNRPEQAVQALEEGIRSDRAFANTYRKRLAVILEQSGQNQRAGVVLDEVLKSEPSDLETRLQRNSIRLTTAKKDEIAGAASDLKALVDAFPWHAGTRVTLGRALSLLGDAQGAAAEYAEATKRNPDSAEARLASGSDAAARGNYRDALRHADHILSLDANDMRARLLRSACLVKLEQHDAAKEEIQRVLRDSPNNIDALLQLAALHLATNKSSEAEKLLKGLQRPGQRDKRPLVALAELYTARGEFQAAKALLQSDFSAAPSELVRIAMMRGDVQAGQYPEAIRNFEALPGQYRSVELYARMTDAYSAVGNLPKAIEVCRKASAMAPDNAMFKNNLAHLLAEEGRNLEEALKLVQDAQRKIASNSPVLADTLAWIYVKDGKNEEALRILEGLAERYPTDGAVQYHLGVALLNSGKRDRARTALRSALVNRPPPNSAQKIKELLANL